MKWAYAEERRTKHNKYTHTDAQKRTTRATKLYLPATTNPINLTTTQTCTTRALTRHG